MDFSKFAIDTQKELSENCKLYEQPLSDFISL